MQIRVRSTLQQTCQILPDKLILVGVSGGADSLCLLDILVRLGYPVVVAHFNHLLRPEASNDARVVEEIANQEGIPFVLGVDSAADYAQEQSLSIEEAARDLRYRFLFGQAEQHSAQAVAVAHNADDQAETVLMHLLRGTGLDGLTGMPYRSLPNPWSKTIPLVRPLLGSWRTEIDAYCAEHHLTPIQDRTNQDTGYFRNRLRHELLPELETYVSGVRARLWQTADLLATDREVLDDLTHKKWADVGERISKGAIYLRLSAFRLQPLSLQRRLVRSAISLLRPGARDLDYSMVKRIIDFAAEPTATGQTDIGLGLRAFLEEKSLVIATWEADLPTAHWPQITDHLLLTIPGELDLGNGWLLRAELPSDIESAQREAFGNENPYQAWVDLGDQQPSLNVRPRLSGERFQPLGMEGKSMKISEFMINQKIPQRARACWPLICTGGEIVWVPGFRMGHPFRLRAETRQVVKLSLKSS